VSLARSRSSWEDLGTVDPYWAILSRPEKRHGLWQEEEFFETGQAEVAQLMQSIDELGLQGRKRVLDFGCGVGRLSRSLARYFDQVIGIDISRPMIFRGAALDTHKQCSFVISDSTTLPLTSNSFDLVLSTIVLQHIPQQSVIRKYIEEFVRVLSPSGLAVVQLPSHIPLRRRLQGRRRLYSWLRATGISEHVLYNRFRLHPIPMNHLPEEEVRSIFERSQCRLIRTVKDGCSGPHIESRTYYARKG
jgi:ubiquinone/menaquinone biosynthesis C-methylase UbiE